MQNPELSYSGICSARIKANFEMTQGCLGNWTSSPGCASVPATQADAEFLHAQRRYTEVSSQLGLRFYNEISTLFRRIIDHPLRYKQFDPPARRLFAHGFPYGVIYVARPDAIWIVAVMHVRREPDYWKDRLAR